MRNWTMWQDHVTEYEDRYRETKNDDGSVTHTPVPGSVIQQGTPQNAANFNKMEDGIINATEMAALAMTAIIHARQTEEDLAGEVINVDLTNTQDYPFNNSIKLYRNQQKEIIQIIQFLAKLHQKMDLRERLKLQKNC